MDWKKAENHLKQCESAYIGVGKAGMFALRFIIAPIRDRFNQGERSQELYDEIMAISL
jgi:hypothetical protein